MAIERLKCLNTEYKCVHAYKSGYTKMRNVCTEITNE